MTEMNVYKVGDKIYVGESYSRYLADREGLKIEEIKITFPETSSHDLIKMKDGLDSSEEYEFELILERLGNAIEDLQTTKVPKMVYGDLFQMMVLIAREFAISHYG